MVGFMISLYSVLMALVLGVTAPWWVWQMVRTGKYREGLRERLGRVPARLTRPGARGCVWVHAVSVGEVLAASRLVEELERAMPGVDVYVSTTTRTGQGLARERFGVGRVFYFPLDFAFAMRGWLRWLRPGLVVLVESELWPRMLVECGRAGVPVAVVNARVSDRSWPRYRRLRVLWRPLVGSLGLVLAQSETDAERLRWLEATGAVCAGNLKYDIRVSGEAAVTGELRRRLGAAVRVVVCGSTLEGEEELLLGALPLDEVVTVLAPRHPERFEEVARLVAGLGVRWERRSGWGVGEIGVGTVVLLDSVGELASVYSLATLAVVGGGFLWPGGHNPLEPAQFGVPVVMGAGYANFRGVVEGLVRERAVVISDAAGLRTTLAKLLADPERSRTMGERGRLIFEQQAGATKRTLAALLPLLVGVEQAGVAGAATRNKQVLP
jgi:3-deoxy-D-manno-octulosonic-acid transferase